MQLGCTMFCCFLCELNSPAKDQHYSAKEWPKHEQLQRGRKNVRNEINKIFLPSLRFKLGMLMKSVKDVVHDGKGFQYFQQKYQTVNQSINTSVNPKSKKESSLASN
jgi:hypothetical protein